jgi:tRNA G10  N-methylase Trm11
VRVFLCVGGEIALPERSPAMAAPADKPTAHRPLLRRKHARRALVNVGGDVETVGDLSLATQLASALAVRAGERDATLTHPFHAYPARLHPAVARALVTLLAPHEHSIVLDPFCGSGTVLIEALVAGRRAMGRDLSPFAVELAALKTRITTVDERRRLVAATRATTTRAEALVRARTKLPVPPEETRWFAPHTLREVAALASLIAREPPGIERDAQRMLLSSVIVKVSAQATDSNTRAVRKPIAPGDALHFFAFKVRELDRCLAALSETVARSIARADLAVDDATTLTTVAAASVHAIVTSPPYANTYDYVAQHARRYAWLDLDDTGMRAGEVGAARWFEVPELGLARFRRELGAMCVAFARVLAPGGVAAVVMADGAAGQEPVRAERLLREAAEAAGLRVVARASQARVAFDHDSAKAFAKRSKREHAVVLAR